MHTKISRWTLVCLSMVLMFALMAAPAFAAVDSSNFPHATGSEMDKDMFQNRCKDLTGKITFSKEPYPNAGGIALNSDSTVYVVKDHNGKDATIYSKEGGGVFAPADSSYLFYIRLKYSAFAATSYDLTGLDTSKVKNMNSMFYNSAATTLDLSGFDTSQVTNMRNMFGGFKGTKLDLSSFDTSKVTSMENMFLSSAATTLDLSGFDTSQVTNMSWMFNYSEATSVLCRTQKDMNKMKASSDCTAVGFHYVGQVHSPDLNLNSNFFHEAVGALTGKITFSTTPYPGGGTPISGISDIPESHGVYAVISEQNATIYTKAGGKTFAPEDSSYLFAEPDYMNATSYDLTGLDTSKVKNMNSMFEGSKVASLDLSSFDTSQVMDMGYMFSCSKATSINLSSFNTSQVTEMNCMFDDSKATSVLCRTQEDALKMEASSYCTATGFNFSHTPEHDMTVNYEWSLDGTTCSATRTCNEPGCNFVAETVEATVSSEEQIPPTHYKKGTNKYTATFDVEWATQQTTTREDIPVKGFDVPLSINAEAATFSVTVPTGLPVAVDAEGNVTCASNGAAKIVNNTTGPVKVTNVEIAGDSGWEVVAFSTNMDGEKVNAKKIAFTVNGVDATALTAEDFTALTGVGAASGSTETALSYTAKIPVQTTALDSKGVANIVFTIGWDEAV